MKVVVPSLNRLWLGGRGSRREIIPALRRSSRDDELVDETVETKMNSVLTNTASEGISTEAN